MTLAMKHRDTVMAGRTRGQHALPITFGKKVSTWLGENRRNIDRLKEVQSRLAKSGILRNLAISASNFSVTQDGAVNANRMRLNDYLVADLVMYRIIKITTLNKSQYYSNYSIDIDDSNGATQTLNFSKFSLNFTTNAFRCSLYDSLSSQVSIGFRSFASTPLILVGTKRLRPGIFNVSALSNSPS